MGFYEDYKKKQESNSSGVKPQRKSFYEDYMASHPEHRERAINAAKEYQAALKSYTDSKGSAPDVATYRQNLKTYAGYLDAETRKSISALYDEGDKYVQQNEARKNAATSKLWGMTHGENALVNKNDWGSQASNVPVSVIDTKSPKKTNAQVVKEMSDEALKSRTMNLSADKHEGKTNDEENAELKYLNQETYRRNAIKENPILGTAAYLKLLSKEPLSDADKAELREAVDKKNNYIGILPESDKEGYLSSLSNKKRADEEYNEYMLRAEMYQHVNMGDYDEWKNNWLSEDDRKRVERIVAEDDYNRALIKDIEASRHVGKELPISSSAVSLITNQLSGLDLVDQIPRAIGASRGEDESYEDRYQFGTKGEKIVKPSFSRITSNIREGVASNLSKTGAGIYQGSMSMLDNVIRNLVGGATGANASKVINFLTFGMGAAASATEQKVSEGWGTNDALKYGLCVGAVEYITEALPFEQVIGLSTGALKKIATKGFAQKLADIFGGLGKSFGAEALEEMASEFIDPIIENNINDKLSSKSMRVDELMAQGYTKWEAEQKYKEEWTDDILKSGLWGGLSGILFGAGNLLVTSNNANNFGNYVKFSNSESDLINLAMTSNDREISNFAKQLKTDGSESHNNLGRLAMLMSQSKDSQTQRAWKNYYDKNLGENSAFAKSYEKAQSNVDIAREERVSSIYEAQKASSNVFAKELTKAGMNEVTANKKAEILSKILSSETVSNIQIKEVVRGSSPETRAILERELGVNLSNSNRESIAIVKDAMRPSQIKSGSIWNKYSDDTEISYDAVDPERAKAVKVRTADGDIEMNLLNVGLNATELVFDTARQLSKSGAQQYVEGLTRNIKTISQLKAYTDTYLKAYTIGLTNSTHSSILKSMLKNPGGFMSSDSIWDAYIAGNKDYVARKEHMQGGARIKNPTVTYDSNVILNKERHKMYQGVTEATQKALEALASTAQVNIRVVNSIKPVVVNGQSYKSNGYYLDGTIYLAADADNPLITVAKHELTHHIKETSGDAYFAYRDFLIHELMNKRGAKFNSMIESYANVYGNLSREEILDEIAADATELFFTDRDTIIKFSKRFSRLAKTVKEFISALTPISTGETKTYAAKELGAARSVVKKAEKLWAEALSSTENENKKSAGTQSKERYSIGYTTDNQPVVVVDDNILEGVPKSEWINAVKDVIKNRFSGGIPVSGRLIKVNKTTRKEYVGSKDSQWTKRNEPVTYKDKFKSANHLDEIVLASVNYINEDLKHARKDNFKEFARGDVLIKVGKNDYSAKVIVGFTSDNKMILYDVIDFKRTAGQLEMKKEVALAGQPQRGISNSHGATSSNNINPKDLSVNTNSMQNQENNSKERFSLSSQLDSSGNNLSEEQQKYFSGSSLVDGKGRLLKLWHATKGTHTIFDPSKSHYDGKLFFSTSPIEMLDIESAKYTWSDDGALMFNGEDITDINDGKVDSFTLDGYNVASYYVNAKKTLFDLTDSERDDLTHFLEENYPDIDAEEFVEMVDMYAYEERESKAFTKWLINNGYDSAQIRETWGVGSDNYYIINPSPEQIKLTSNSDPTRNPDARYSLSQSFEKQVDDVINNRHDPNNHIYMGNTPPRLSNILGLKKLPMLITSRHVFTMTMTEAQAKNDPRYNNKDHYHGLGKDIMKKLPKAIDKPVFIIKSNTDVNNARFVIATDLFDKQGNRIIVAVEPGAAGYFFDIEIESNMSLSGYGKKNFLNYLEAARNEDRILYAFDKYNQRNQNTPGVQFPDTILSADYSDNLSQFRKIVNNKYMQNRENDSGNAERNQISHEEFERMAEKYGYHVVRDPNVKVPLQTNDKNRVRRHVATVMSDGNITAEMVEDLEDAVVKDLFSYKPSSDAKALEYAQQVIERGTAESDWKRIVNPIEENKNEMKAPDKNDIALGEALLVQAIESGDRAKVVQLTAELSAIGTRAGQVVQAMSLLRKMTGVGTVYAVQKNVEQLQKELNLQYKNKAPKLEIDPALMEQLAMEKDADKIAQIEEKIYAQVASQIKTNWADKLTAWRYLSMLGNLRTHIRNFLGNAAFVPVARMKNAVQFALERTPLYRKARENGRTVSIVISKEYKNFAKADYDNIKEDLQAGGKHNPTDAIRKRVRTFNTRWLEHINQFNGNMLEAEDGAFLRLHYVHALGGYLQAQKVDINNVSEGILKAARTHAFQEALEATYRDASAIADAINKLGRKNAFLKVAVEGVLPFKKTPLNILKRGVEYSPMGLVKALSLDIAQVHKGNMTSYEMMNDLSKGITGIGLTLIGYLLTSLGRIRGSGGDDKEDRFDELLGYQNYAIQGDGWSYTIDWMAPGSLPLFVGVELFNIFHDEYSSFGDYLNSFVSIADPIYDLSMLQGINTMIESAGYSDSSLTTIATTAVTSYLSQYVPTAAGQLARTIDGTRRTTFTETSGLAATLERMWDKTVNKIPGASFTGAEYINQWGETETGDNSVLDVALRILENFASPGYASDIDVDEAESLILDLYEKTGEASLLPKYADKTITVNDETIRLTEAEYNKFAKRKGTLQHEIIMELAKNSSFKSLSDADQAEVVSTVYTWAGQIAKSEINSDYKLPSSAAKMLAAEKEGISNAEFITAYKTINAYEADKDSKGQSISGSKKAKKVDYIESLSMTKAQKDWLLEEIA